MAEKTLSSYNVDGPVPEFKGNGNFISRWTVGDEIDYKRFAHSPEYEKGLVVGLYFTKSKVFYDILNQADSRVDTKISSAYVGINGPWQE